MSTKNKFRRQVAVKTARELSEKLNPDIKAVGVFVDGAGVKKKRWFKRFVLFLYV